MRGWMVNVCFWPLISQGHDRRQVSYSTQTDTQSIPHTLSRSTSHISSWLSTYLSHIVITITTTSFPQSQPRPQPHSYHNHNLHYILTTTTTTTSTYRRSIAAIKGLSTRIGPCHATCHRDQHRSAWEVLWSIGCPGADVVQQSMADRSDRCKVSECSHTPAESLASHSRLCCC